MLNLVLLIANVLIEVLPTSFLLHIRGFGRSGFISIIAVVLFIFAFANGFDTGHGYLRAYSLHHHNIQLKDSSIIQGKIIRSGEKGVLLVDPEGRLQFLRLDNVVSIFYR